MNTVATRRPATLRLARWQIIVLTAALPVLLLGAYTATNVAASLTQKRLASRWEQLLTHPAGSPAEAARRVFAPGEPVARIGIASIGMDLVAAEGTGTRGAPGHLSSTSLPGLPGLAAVQGSRFAYGNQFQSLERLLPGDAVTVQTLAGITRMTVTSIIQMPATQIDTTLDAETPALLLIAPTRAWGGPDRIVVRADATEGPSL